RSARRSPGRPWRLRRGLPRRSESGWPPSSSAGRRSSPARDSPATSRPGTERRSMKGLKDRVAVVTGGANGIGAGLARAFVQAGSKVVAADVNGTQGEELARELGERCVFQRTDLRSDSDLERLVACAVERFGGIDFLINAACTYADGGAEADRATWQNGFDV